jgi:2-oxoisovalerate dehydrogenase E1 component
MKTVDLRTEVPWLRAVETDADWKAVAPRELRRMFEQILLIRRFEENLLALSTDGLLHGPAHSSIGQEGAAVGCMAVLRSEDKINGTHRMHHQFLAKALNHVTPADHDPAGADFSPAMEDVVHRTLAEILGLTPGYGGGRGGSMHLKWDECGVLGSNAIVGGNIPHAVGYALAEKMKGTGNVAVAFFGDGAMQNGAAYESMNLAALYRLPVIFFCENNLYAVSTHLREQTAETRLSGRGVSLGIPGVTVDGMNPVLVRAAVAHAKAHIARDGGPWLVEVETYRFLHQSGPLPGSAFGYREKDEEARWQARDPLAQMWSRLQDMGVVSAADRERYDSRVAAVVSAATQKLVQGAVGGKRRLVPALWPDPATVDAGIRGDLSELERVTRREQSEAASAGTESIKFADAISLAAREAMERDDRIIILGEDVHRLKGGTAGATKGIRELFPERLLGTPICENGFVGMALGAALNGLRPIVEIMYPDFALGAADQLFNQAAKVRHMFGGHARVPLVVRSRVSSGSGYGSQHSMDASGLFAMYPGWRIVVPSTPHDYVGLFNAAVRCDDPVLIVEHQSLFQTSGPVPVDDLDYIVPFGKARMVRTGSACTVLTYGGVILEAQAAAEASGIDAEIIDLRSLDPLGIDWDMIGQSLAKTNRLMVAEQTTRGTSIGAHIVSRVQELFFDHLDHEIVHVAGAHSSPVVSKVLEHAALAHREEIATALRALVAG